MPQGKGTYGSQVGRPSKKKKYQEGGSIDPFSTKNPKGIMAQKEMEAIEDQNAVPTINAMDRSQTSPMGDEVGTGMYAYGGKVAMARSVKEERKKMVEKHRKIQKEKVRTSAIERWKKGKFRLKPKKKADKE